MFIKRVLMLKDSLVQQIVHWPWSQETSGCEPRLLYTLLVWSWASQLTFLGLNALICKIEITYNTCSSKHMGLSVKKYLLSTYYVPGTVQSLGIQRKVEDSSHPQGAFNLIGEAKEKCVQRSHRQNRYQKGRHWNFEGLRKASWRRWNFSWDFKEAREAKETEGGRACQGKIVQGWTGRLQWHHVCKVLCKPENPYIKGTSYYLC